MTGDRPRHSRKEIRSFADELDRDGWAFETVDASGHTIWSHPRATGRFKLPETPRHFDVQRARRDVARLLGRRPATGKRNGKAKPVRQRQDFALQAVQRAADQRPGRPAPTVNGQPVERRRPRRLPWEGQPDDYNRGIDRLMREAPGGRR